MDKKYNFINTFYVTKINKKGLKRIKNADWNGFKLEDIRFVGLDTQRVLVFDKTGKFIEISGHYFQYYEREETDDYNIDFLKKEYNNYL